MDFDKLWNFEDPGATERAFRERLEEGKGNEGASYELQLMTQIARAEGLQRKFADAHVTLDDVENRMDREPAVVRVRYLLERGRVFNSSGQQDNARPLFEQAWEAAQVAREDGYAVDAAHMMGIVEPPHAALAWNEKAIALAESSDQDVARAWLGSLYNNTGWTYHDSGDFTRALELFRKALDWHTERGQESPTRVAKWCVARALRSLERIDEALGMQQSLLVEYEAAGSKSGFVFEELAECHLALGHADDAKRFFALAHEELAKDAWLSESEPKRIARLEALGAAT